MLGGLKRMVLGKFYQPLKPRLTRTVKGNYQSQTSGCKDTKDEKEKGKYLQHSRPPMYGAARFPDPFLPPAL